MPRTSPILLAALVLALAIAGCGDDDDGGGGGGQGSSTTSATLAAPEDAARCLFDAWIDGDLGGARRCADDIAVDELFARPLDEGSLTFAGCTEEGPTLRCAWSGERGLSMLVVDSDAYGWRVSDVENTAD